METNPHFAAYESDDGHDPAVCSAPMGLDKMAQPDSPEEFVSPASPAAINTRVESTIPKTTSW